MHTSDTKVKTLGPQGMLGVGGVRSLEDQDSSMTLFNHNAIVV